MLVTVLTAALAGLVPAIHAGGFDLHAVLRDSATRSASSGAGQGRLRSLLIVVGSRSHSFSSSGQGSSVERFSRCAGLTRDSILVAY